MERLTLSTNKFDKLVQVGKHFPKGKWFELDGEFHKVERIDIKIFYTMTQDGTIHLQPFSYLKKLKPLTPDQEALLYLTEEM